MTMTMTHFTSVWVGSRFQSLVLQQRPEEHEIGETQQGEHTDEPYEESSGQCWSLHSEINKD